MKIYFAGVRGDTLDILRKRGVVRRLDSFSDIKTASGRQARRVAIEHGWLKTPGSQRKVS